MSNHPYKLNSEFSQIDRHTVIIPYDDLLATAKALCEQNGVELPPGDWKLFAEHMFDDPGTAQLTLVVEQTRGAA
ncbi:MAG: hypothetical protein ACPG4X_14545 [Pikeienuella sp.]